MADPQEKQKQDSGTFFALTALVMAGVGIVLFCSLMIPSILGIFAVLMGFVFIIYVQYVIWLGLSRLTANDAEKPDDE